MDEIIFEEGSRRTKIHITGVDPHSGTISEEDFKLSLYGFETEPQLRPLYTAEFDVAQAASLFDVLSRISIVKNRNRPTSGRFIEIGDGVPIEVVRSFLNHPELLGNPDVIRAVLAMNPELSRAIMETEIQAVDVHSLAFRRKQLEEMEQLLYDQAYFAARQEELQLRGKEPVWQDFFERNQWIFGFALHYVIGEGVQPERLEQVVAGHSIAGAGKRTDALLQTRGILKSLCYVEIKHHETNLVHAAPYRPEVWRPSTELGGAIAQSQKTVQLSAENIGAQLQTPAGSFFNYAPHAIVICGMTQEFLEEGIVNEPKFSSFELFRRNIQSPEILTFDELHDRASAIVEAKFERRRTGEAANTLELPSVEEPAQ